LQGRENDVNVFYICIVLANQHSTLDGTRHGLLSTKKMATMRSAAYMPAQSKTATAKTREILISSKNVTGIFHCAP
jgi:hypothetical protein